MKPPLSDTLVICDMDNTLLTAKELSLIHI